MLRVNVGEQELGVKFYHRKDGKNQGTACVITNASKEVIGEGYAKKHKTDQFNKVIGRQFALERAVASAFPGSRRENPENKSIRQAIFDSYRDNCTHF